MKRKSNLGVIGFSLTLLTGIPFYSIRDIIKSSKKY